jgi:hypothetical protein
LVSLNSPPSSSYQLEYLPIPQGTQAVDAVPATVSAPPVAGTLEPMVKFREMWYSACVPPGQYGHSVAPFASEYVLPLHVSHRKFSSSSE